MENKKFDYEALKKGAALRLKKGGSMLGKDGVFTPLFKEFFEEALISGIFTSFLLGGMLAPE